MRVYLASMFALVLLDLFDKLFERYGVRVSEWELYPDMPIVFGRIEGVRDRKTGVLRDHRFLIVKIPFVKTWGITNFFMSPIPEYGFRSHKLIWVEGLDFPEIGYRSLRIDPPFEGWT